MDEDLGRYNRAAGWRQHDPHKKLREKIRKQQEKEDRRVVPILRRSVDEHAEVAEQLFHTVWRTGEVALLFGEPAVGKSIFAVNLAEAIAGNADALLRTCEETTPSARRVVYIDLQRTDDQWKRRFSGTFTQTTFERLHLDWDDIDPSADDSIRASRIQASIGDVIEGGAEVVILDDITLGGINLGRPNGPLRTLRTLKMFAADSGASILVIAGARPQKRPRTASLSDVAFRHIAEQADSVFCLSRSTFNSEFRYVRHLRSASGPLVHDASAVLTFQLIAKNEELPVDSGQLPVDSGDSFADTSLENASAPIPQSAIRSPQSNSSSLVPHHSSLRFKYLGDCPESEHLRDYAAEARVGSPHVSKGSSRLPSARNALTDGILDGSYLRYLKGP